MRWLTTLIFTICFSAGFAFHSQAQAPYTGGEGDGYARSSTSFRIGDPPVVDARVDLGLSEENGQWTLVLWLEGVATGVEIEAFDVRGRRLANWETTGEGAWEERHSLHNWSSAVYIFRITIDEQYEFTEKVLNPYHVKQ